MRIKKSENIAESPEKENKNPKKRAAGSHFPVAVICCIVLAACLLSGCGKGQEGKKASEKSKDTSASSAFSASSAPSASSFSASSAPSASSTFSASSAPSASSAFSASSVSPDYADTSAAAIADDKKAEGPHILKYIDAWHEWHTMEVDPAVRETAYDVKGFIHTEGTSQWVIYSGDIVSQTEKPKDTEDGSPQEGTPDTAQTAAPAEQMQDQAEMYECLQGIDVSEHQGMIDWQAVADAGYQFAFIRVGYRGYGEAGTIVEDTMAVDNLQQAKSAGLQVGAYFFSQALSEDEAAEEAALAVSVIGKSGVEIDLPLMYDPEIIKDDWGRANEITREQVALNTAAFRETVENSSSCKVDIYSNLPWEHNYFDTDTMNTYDIWYADYEPLPQTPYHFTWWQYTNEGSVPGIEGPVDLNLWIRRSDH